MPWLSTDTKRKPRQRKSAKEPIHPIFGECAQLVCDPFWKSILGACVYGKFPRGCSYSDGKLLYRKKAKVGKVAEMRVSSDPRLAAPAVVSFIRDNAGLRSDIDKIQEFHEKEQQERPVKFRTAIRGRKARTAVVLLFVEQVGLALDLTEEEKVDLRTKINVGFLQGHFVGASFIFAKGRLEWLRGLVYDEDSRTFFIDGSTAKTSKGTRGADVLSASEYCVEKLDERGLQSIDLMESWDKHRRRTKKDKVEVEESTGRTEITEKTISSEDATGD